VESCDVRKRLELIRKKIVSEERPKDALSPNKADYVASAIRAALGAVPFAGSVLTEIADTIVPHQRIDRIVQFAQELESRLSEVQKDFVRSQLTNENFTDLMEESLRQAARSVSQVRRAHIAALIANSLSTENVSYVESKHLLRVLGELNDIEIIRLVVHLYDTFGSGTEYWDRHADILQPIAPSFGSAQPVIDRGTLQASYDAHLAQLGLLSPKYRVDTRTKQPVFNSHSGTPTVNGYSLTPFGRLFLRQMGVSVGADHQESEETKTNPPD
jgi:hypothetical protein